MTPNRIADYELVRELGRGGMGVVYEARHPNVPRPLALKALSADARDVDVQRFLREAQLLAQVQHPGVVRIHTAGRAPQGPYLVSELVLGDPLDDVLRAGPLAPERAARIVRALADAVAAVHRAGVLHRDLKPGNVILGADDRPTLLDFGLARTDGGEALTRTGDLLGTPVYMSPEQADGTSSTQLGPEVDVYGLGAVLFALLAARPPFAGTSIQVVKQVLMNDPRWPRADDPSIPAGLEAICKRAMAKARADRYPTATALRDALDAFLEDPSAGAASGSGLKGLALVGAAAVVALLVWVAWGLTRPAPPAAEPAPPPTVTVTPERRQGPSPQAAFEALRRHAQDGPGPKRLRAYREGCAAERELRRRGANPGLRARLRRTLRTHYAGQLLLTRPVPFASQQVYAAFLEESRLVLSSNEWQRPVGGSVQLFVDGTPDLRVTTRRTRDPKRAPVVTELRVPRGDRSQILFTSSFNELYVLDAATFQAKGLLPEGWTPTAEGDVHPALTFEFGPPVFDTERPPGRHGFAVSSDGRQVLIGGRWKKARVFSLQGSTPTLVRELGDHAHAVFQAAWATDQSLILTASGTRPAGQPPQTVGSLYAWGVASTPTHQHALGSLPVSLQVDPSHPRRAAVGLFSGGIHEFTFDETLRHDTLSAVHMGLVNLAHTASVRGMAYATDGTLFSCSRGNESDRALLRLWRRAADGSLQPGGSWPVDMNAVADLAISPNGDLLVLGSFEGTYELRGAPHRPE